MPGKVVHPYRLEGARPHMQCDKGGLRPALDQALHDPCIEMQACCRSGHGTRSARVDGLVAFVVSSLVGPPDIGWQRYMPVPLQHVEHIRLSREIQHEQVVIPAFHNCRDPFLKQQ